MGIDMAPRYVMVMKLMIQLNPGYSWYKKCIGTAEVTVPSNGGLWDFEV